MNIEIAWALLFCERLSDRLDIVCSVGPVDHAARTTFTFAELECHFDRVINARKWGVR
jgi:hypothetical protein